jgi:hypothetical protein
MSIERGATANEKEMDKNIEDWFLQETVRVYLVLFVMTAMLSAGTALAGWAQDNIAFRRNPPISNTACRDSGTVGGGVGDGPATGSNIDIANNGIADDVNTIRIGTVGIHTPS